MTLVNFAGNFNFDILYSNPGCHVLENFFNDQVYRSCGHTTLEVHGYKVREYHTLKCRAVTRKKAKLTSIKQVVSVDKFFE
jgi:hypothetical protein